MILINTSDQYQYYTISNGSQLYRTIYLEGKFQEAVMPTIKFSLLKVGITTSPLVPSKTHSITSTLLNVLIITHAFYANIKIYFKVIKASIFVNA